MDVYESFNDMDIKLKYISILLKQEPRPWKLLKSSFYDISRYFESEDFVENARIYKASAERVKRRILNLHNHTPVPLPEYNSFIMHLTNAITLSKIGGMETEEFQYHMNGASDSLDSVIKNIVSIQNTNLEITK